jgi:hypothetical protein
MANEHNPVALRINHIQEKWIRTVREKKNFKIVQWLLSNEDDLPLLNGFYQIESSPRKKMEEVLVVMFTNFENPDTYSYEISKSWIEEYEKSLKKYPDLPWQEFFLFKERIEQIESPVRQGELLVDILSSYQRSIPLKQTKLVVGIIPRKVFDYKKLNQWLNNLVKILPENVAITLTDYRKNNFYLPLISQNKEYSLSILLEDMNIKDTYGSLINQGKTNDPQVQFRACAMELGKAASRGNRKEVHQWGEKLLDIGQSTANKILWASAHLMYAGFLFTFKDGKILTLLNKGKKISKSVLPDDPAVMGTLLQLYNYTASHYSMSGKHETALQEFLEGARLALEYKDIPAAISACKNAILLAERYFMKSTVSQFLETAFPKMYTLEDSRLKATEFPFIAHYHLSHSKKISDEQYEEINERMIKLFGNHWRKQSLSKTGSSPGTLN